MNKITLDQANPFFKELFKDWMLVAAQYEGKTGAMTISWGGIGYMWNKPVVYTAIRPQRHTKSIVDKVDTYSLSVLKDELHDKHLYFGKISGHTEDKIVKSGMEIEYSNNTPYFKDSKRVYICKKMFAQPFNPANFLQPEQILKLYNDDYHTLYISEILEILEL